MRRIIVFAIVLVCLVTGCKRSQSQTAEATLVPSGDLSITQTQQTTISHNPFEDWEKYVPKDAPRSYDLVATDVSALAIANVILERSLTRRNDIEYTSVNIWEDVEHGVWIVSYYPQSTRPDTEIAGGDIHIVIRKYNAQVVSVWSGE